MVKIQDSDMKPTASVGVRELKENLSRYLRMLRDENVEIDMTIRGKVVARLVPVHREIATQEPSEFWRHHQEPAEQIGAHLPPGVSAVEAVKEQRREL